MLICDAGTSYMSEMIFFNQRYLTDAKVQQRLQECAPHHDWCAMSSTVTFYPRTSGMYCRHGHNTLPFKTQICDALYARMPIDFTMSESFSDVCDQRCLDLWARFQHQPWIIAWSGGIDSTLIVCSIMRNLGPAQRKNIRIACNEASVYEYPWFFENVIRPNFDTVDASIQFDPMSIGQSLVFNGEPADQLFPGAVLMPMIHSGVDINTDMFKHPTQILNYLERGADRRFAQWFYQCTVDNIKSVDLDLTSYFDFFWWVSFNFNWTGLLLRSVRNRWMDIGSIEPYRQQFINWYNCQSYQAWAINNRQQLISHSVGDYKKPFKDYIYEFTRDHYYHRFKLKTTSTSIASTKASWIAILDDWTLLTADQMDQVLDLLPDHVEK